MVLHMSQPNYPITPAITFLTEMGVSFEPHTFEYEEKGGTKVSSRKLGVDEHCVIKTLVFKNEKSEPFIVLMHGDRHVSLKALTQQLGYKKIAPENPDAAQVHTGYFVGGTSPFGLKKNLPIFVERSILELPKIFINGGQRGFLVSIKPEELKRVLDPKPVDVAEAKKA
jgi:Cys-tRNA(Pro) deacylase